MGFSLHSLAKTRAWQNARNLSISFDYMVNTLTMRPTPKTRNSALIGMKYRCSYPSAHQGTQKSLSAGFRPPSANDPFTARR